jgi:hypothetical protein
MRNISEKIVEKIKKIHIQYFFSQNSFLWINVEKYCTARQATDYNMEQVRCMLDN